MRIHEVSKKIGTTSKVIMTELERAGMKYATHMAVLDEKALAYLTKKYPSLTLEVETKGKGTSDASSSQKTADDKAKKPRSRSSAKSKVVTQRSVQKKAEREGVAREEPLVDTDSVEVLQRQEGAMGTVTLEQRVVSGGILRRRRIEAPPPAPVVETPVAEPEVISEGAAGATADQTFEPLEDSRDEQAKEQAGSLDIVSEDEPVLGTGEALSEVEAAVEAVAPAEVIAPKVPDISKENISARGLRGESRPESEDAVVDKSNQEQGVHESTTAQTISATPVAPSTPVKPGVSEYIAPSRLSTGRNLSSPSRLKIVATPAVPPKPFVQRTAVAAPVDPTKPKSRSLIATPEPKGDRAADAAHAKKKPVFKAEGEEPGRPTKRELLGMVEEVEITRPLGRKPKKNAMRVKLERKQTQITTPGVQRRIIRIEDEISVSDLADRMGIKGVELVRKLIGVGQMVTLHHKLDHDTAAVVASDFGYEVQNVAETAEQLLDADTSEGDSGDLEHRAPIVTVMGHVDHGKTSLLDTIRKTRVASGEAGGITQHIGAYQVESGGKKITFIDTPGHAAFTAMRARGASVTDMVILVVAADEGVKPQTLEALAHAKAAKVPIMVAINKMDKPDANPDRVIQELSGQGLVPESWGGDTMYMRVSAHTGDGVPELLESILLQAEVLDLKADPKRPAKGIIVESRLDRGKGPVASVIVQSGTLEVGQYVVCGTASGRVRALLNERGQSIKTAGPSTPVEFLGLDSVPNAGDLLRAVTDEAVAKRVQEMAVQHRQKEDQSRKRVSLEDIHRRLQHGEVTELRVILKGDVQGSVEAITDSLLKIKHDKVKVNVIFKAVGGVTESDIDLAAASGGIVFGFNVRPTSQAKALAERVKVQLRTYEIIYELIDEVKKAMQGLLAPIIKETVLGQAEVREVFNVSKVGPVAGSFIKSGKVVRSAPARLIRDSVVVVTTRIKSLRRFKDEAKEVAEGFECGILLDNYNDIKVGDIVECFENTEIQQAVS